MKQSVKWYKHKETLFILLFVGIFFVSFVILYFLGLIPNELIVDTSKPSALDQLNEHSIESVVGGNNSNNYSVTILQEEPIKIEAATIGLSFSIENPTTDNYQALDSALVRGAVHYPGSGFPGAGNMFIFGHSTGFKVVNNKAYQVFNNIHNLQQGDEIKIYSKDKVYSYRVSSVKLEKDSNAYVNFSTNINKLTLSTCNSFGAKEDRYVVEADYVSS